MCALGLCGNRNGDVAATDTFRFWAFCRAKPRPGFLLEFEKTCKAISVQRSTGDWRQCHGEKGTDQDGGRQPGRAMDQDASSGSV